MPRVVSRRRVVILKAQKERTAFLSSIPQRARNWLRVMEKRRGKTEMIWKE